MFRHSKLAGVILIVSLILVLGLATIVSAASLQVDNSVGSGCNDTTGTPYCTIQAAINAAMPGDTINIAPGIYTENVNVNKALTLQGSAGGSFSAPVATAPTAAPGVWYTDRYAPAVFESYDFGGEMVLRHGVRVADSAANRPSSFSSTFYNNQGRKLDTDLTGAVQSMSIDIWVDAAWAGADRSAGLWSTGFDSGGSISAYPILAWRSGPAIAPAVNGFYAFDYINGGYILLMAAQSGDYGAWHKLTFELTVGSGVDYKVDGELKLFFPDPDTTELRNVILNVYNFGADYDVYWDNWMVGSESPATYEPTVSGLMTISASGVEVTGLYLTNPGQAYGVLASGALDNIKIANNRIQDVGGSGTNVQVKGVYVLNGPDNVTIEHNAFRNIVAGSTKSSDAIFVGDSNSTDSSTGLIIKDNTFSSISAGRGAYGILINPLIGTPDAQIIDNTFSGLEGSWTHAIGLEGPTSNAVVTGNVFSDLLASGIDNAAVFFEKNPAGDTVDVSGNQFNGTAFYGVAVHPNDLPGGANGNDYTVVAENNWWGTACGPGPVGPATGALVGLNVDFSPWWTAPSGPDTAGFDGDAWIVPSGSTTAQTNAIIACAGPGSTVRFEGGSYPGGIIVTNPGITFDLNGATMGPGSPAFTVSAANTTVLGGTLDGGGSADPAVLVKSGGDNFIMQDVEVKGWEDGVQVEASVTSFKLVSNWFHDNADAGLQVDSGVVFSGVVTIEGNLFKDNTGDGVRNESGNSLDATYNSWGDIGGPAVGAGDGVSTDVVFTPWTFTEFYLDVDPDSNAIQRDVAEDATFDVKLKAEAANLYGIAFKFTYDTDLLTYNGVTFAAEWSGKCVGLVGLAADEIGYRCNLISGPEWNGGDIGTFSFTADLPGIANNDLGPWQNLFDIQHVVADTSAAAIGGVKVFVNNAGYGAPSAPDRDITDDNDGQIDITGLANFTGFVNLQGRANDSGATLTVYDQMATSGSTALASGVSVSSGQYTSAYINPNQLLMGETYWLQIDADLFLPTTVKYPALVSDWDDSADTLVRPLTSLNTVLLLGGDAYNDDQIDVSDATCIGSNYGTVTTTCGGASPANSSPDVNIDGIVDILDLALMGGNYTLTSSPWTAQ